MGKASGVALIGFMGAGKSTVGRLLAEQLQLAFVDLDRLIEARAATDIPSLFGTEGEEGFRAREAAALAEVLAGEGLVLACGGGTPCQPESMASLVRWGRTVFLDVTLAVLRQRVTGEGRPLWDEDTESRLAQRQPFYRRADLTVDGDRVPEEVVKGIVAGLQTMERK